MVGIYSLSEAIYYNPSPTRPAYNISGKELPPLPSPPPPPPQNNPNPLIANDQQGLSIFRQCASCHTVSKQGPNRVGPSLWNIVNRPVASQTNYRYSRALQELRQSGAVWDEARLDRYITAPAKAVVGTSMAFRGLTDAHARAALIAYLRTLVPEANEQEQTDD